jgi:undecaprenyl-diphosphatase
MIDWIQAIDAGTLRWFAAARTPALDGFFAAATWAGSLWLIAPASLALAWFAWRRGGGRRAALLLALGPPVASLAGWAVKFALDRARPALFAAPVDLPADPSFPSGHTLQATAFALASLLAWHAAGQRVATWMVATAAAYVALIGASRLYLQVHYPSDVAAGLVLGAACVLALQYIVTSRRIP